jgi:hypothetical protein
MFDVHIFPLNLTQYPGIKKNLALMGADLICSPADRGCTGQTAGWWIWQKEAR